MNFAYKKDMNVRGSEAECYGLNVSSKNSYVETLTSNVMVFEAGVFGRY